MIAKEINITHTGQILASFIIGLCLCLWTALNMKPSIGVAIGFIPFATLFIFICINRPVILLAITFMLNYLIMGINRYHSIPIAITNIFDLLQSSFQENTKRLYLHHIGLAAILYHQHR